MTVKIWNSYSCNNSSSFRLVARFASPAAATAVAAELEAFFPVHAAEIDERGDYDEQPSEAQQAIGAKHGFTFEESLYWGDDGLAGDEPKVFVRDSVLIVQHTYCGGLGELAGLTKALGATSADEQDDSTVAVSLLFRLPTAADPELDTELAALFEQLGNTKDRFPKIKPPWAEQETYGKGAWFRDTGTVGIHLPVDPGDLDALDGWLAEHGIDKPSIEIEAGDAAKFAAIAKARCTSCQGQLDYLDPRLHDIESPQLVCKPCGGLYELSTFLPAKS